MLADLSALKSSSVVSSSVMAFSIFILLFPLAPGLCLHILLHCSYRNLHQRVFLAISKLTLIFAPILAELPHHFLFLCSLFIFVAKNLFTVCFNFLCEVQLSLRVGKSHFSPTYTDLQDIAFYSVSLFLLLVMV